MAANVSSVAIAALVSVLLVAPLPSETPAERSLHVLVGPSFRGSQQVIPPFSEPKLRTLELPLTEPFIGFKSKLDSITIAGEGGSPPAHLAALDLPEAQPGGGGGAMAGVAVPNSLAAPQPESAEEFPGAVPVSVPRLAANPKWRRIIEENPQRLRAMECSDGPAAPCTSSPWTRWNDLVRRVSALEGEERLQAVNEGVNDLLTYASDEEVYGVGDYWATLEESLTRGRGDCEDIAIAKMWLLNAAGVDLSHMRLVVLKDTLRNLDHAVLSVMEDGHQYVLDNTAWKVGHADWMRGYRPIYALSSEQSWIYGMRVPTASPLQVAQSTAPQSPQ